ncbi:hypothetical protein JCM19301_2996 [Jejuia pallidilutea]|uniref:Uncharacterized protein n=1 Tax=Jejuia pallidilutea TaxID=504487 RepID=A0A090VRB1_9FLAO|nr:hypothetical protein JCM19301_2996 [Jejuia pallidilutea]GAL69776.1 hypothetical protein JCM19302_671 [Jejuia pallidilutea]
MGLSKALKKQRCKCNMLLKQWRNSKKIKVNLVKLQQEPFCF